MAHSLRRFVGKVSLERALRRRPERMGISVTPLNTLPSRKARRNYISTLRKLEKELHQEEKTLLRGRKGSVLPQKLAARRARVFETMEIVRALKTANGPLDYPQLLSNIALHANLNVSRMREIIRQLELIQRRAGSGGNTLFTGGKTIAKSYLHGEWLQPFERHLRATRKPMSGVELLDATKLIPTARLKRMPMATRLFNRDKAAGLLGLLEMAGLVTKLGSVEQHEHAFVHAEHRFSPSVWARARESRGIQIMEELLKHGPGTVIAFTRPMKSFSTSPKVGTRMRLNAEAVRRFLDWAIPSGFVEITGTEKKGQPHIMRLTPLGTKLVQQSIEKKQFSPTLRRAQLGKRAPGLKLSQRRRLEKIKECWYALEIILGMTTESFSERAARMRYGSSFNRTHYKQARAWRGMRREKIDFFIREWNAQASSENEKKSIHHFKEYLLRHPSELAKK